MVRKGACGLPITSPSVLFSIRITSTLLYAGRRDDAEAGGVVASAGDVAEVLAPGPVVAGVPAPDVAAELSAVVVAAGVDGPPQPASRSAAPATAVPTTTPGLARICCPSCHTVRQSPHPSVDDCQP